MKHLFSIFTAIVRPLQLLVLGGSLLMASGASAQGFSVPGGGNPPGWTLSDDPDGGDDVIQADHFRLEAGLDVNLEKIVTASYNLNGYTNVTFTVDVSRFSTGSPNPLTVEVSTDGGATFTQTYTAAAPTSAVNYDPRTYNIAIVSATTVLRLTNQGTGGRGVKLKNLVLAGTAPVATTISTGTILGSPFCVGASGEPVNVPYTIGGSYTAGNVFTAQLSDASGSFAAPLAIGTRTATNAGTIAATLPNTVSNGTGYRIRVISSMPAVTGTDNGVNLTITNASMSVVTGLNSNPSNAQITLQWTNPVSCFDGVLVIARANAPVSSVPNGAVTYSANANFGSGSQLQPGEYVVYQGAGTDVTVTGLTNGTTYHFAVFARRATVYGPGVTISETPTSGPSLTEVLVPRYLSARPASGTTHLNRLPYAFRVTLNGLLPNTTYRYVNRAVSPVDAADFNGVGNAIFPNAAGFTRVATSTPLSTGYNTLTSSAVGTYTGWFVLEPNADVRFTAGNLVRMRILLNDGTASDVVATRLTTSSTVTALLLGTTAADGTGIVDSSLAAPRNFVLLYDNEAGTGRPLAGTFVESDGSPNTTANGYTGFYASRVEAKSGKWGTLIPNTNAAGVRRIEQRALSNGAIVGCVATDADGIWSSLASTVNPMGGPSPVVLSAVDAPLACGVYVAVNPTTQSYPEGNTGTTLVPIRITVNTAPATPLTIQVSNAGGGTAAIGSDYFFNTQTLTFPTSGTYPMTLTVNAQFVGDVIVESNESFNLNITIISGSATVLQVPGRVVILDDDFLATGLIINEMSKGAMGQQEYVELLVTGTPGTTVDLRGWTLDDNNGAFSGGVANNVGINDGHFRFDNHCTWEKVRVGSIIVLYNAADRNPSLPPVDDPTDADLDFLYVVPVLNTGACGVVTGASSDYLEGNCTAPNTASAAYAAANVGPSWSQIGINNSDAIQLRQPASPEPTLYHGLSFANNGNSSINAVNHPDYATKGADALFFQGVMQTYFFDNTAGNDFRSKANWMTQAGSGQESPGTPNSIRNGQFIESLRQPLVPTSTSATYTCDVRANETRVFLDANHRLMLRLNNQSTTSYDAVTSETVVGPNSQNTNLEGEPYFLGKQYRVTPTTSSPANYVVTFYVTDAELDSYASYVSAQTGQPRTSEFLRSRLQIYKNSGNVLPSMAPDGTMMNIASAVVGSYSSGVTTYSATFTSFSTFAIGASTQAVLPVELTRLTASVAPNHTVRVEWATASEQNADHFAIQRSADGREFTTIGQVQANGTSLVGHTYAFVDSKPLAGVGYYRLLQVDTGNKQGHLSDIVSVRFGAPVASALEAWPVPMGAELHLRLTAPATGVATVRLLDLQGRVVLQRSLVLTAGSTELTLPTEGLSAGTYVAETLLPTGGVVRTKVVK